MDANVTLTAQALGSSAQAIHDLAAVSWSWNLIFTQILGVAAWALSTVQGQHLIEALVTKFNPPFYIKVMIPTVLGSLIGMLLKASNMDAETARNVAIAWIGAVHVINETPLAANLENKAIAKLQSSGQVTAADALKQIQDLVDKAANGAGGAVGVFLLGFLLLAGTAKAATINLTQDFGAGLDRYNPTAGGVILPTGVTAISYGLNLDYTVDMTPLSSTAAVPDRILVFCSGPAWSPLVQGPGGLIGWHIEIGSQIPSTPVNLVVGTIADFGTGKSNPWGITGAINFQFGGTLGSWVVNW